MCAFCMHTEFVFFFYLQPLYKFGMSTETSYHLQQSLYTLYRNYYHSGCVTLLYNKDFAEGTYQITKGGLYVICEDIIFKPDEANLKLETKYSSNKAYGLGFFAALTVECADVVIDLQGHTIRQSFAHYLTQRFFSVIELASSPFIAKQGPGLVNQSASEYPLMIAKNCLIINGTLGLSSHGCVHGNNNENIVLQHMTVQDFESSGIQLNGVKNAFIDCVTVTGTCVAPVGSLTFTLLQHKKKLDEMIAANADLLVDTSDYVVSCTVSLSKQISHKNTQTDLQTIVDALTKPFADADEAFIANGTTNATVKSILREIWLSLKSIADTTDHKDESLDAEIQRFVMGGTVDAQTGTTVACPDGSAIYGILIHQSGVAVGELSDACVNTGGPCCPMIHSKSKCSKNAESVTIHNCTVSNLLTNSHEACGLFYPTSKKFGRDHTGAVLDCRTIVSGSVLEHARVLVNQTNATKWSLEIQCLLVFGRDAYSWQTFIENSDNVEFRYNIDIMAHISKGVFGVRVEDVTGLSIENVTVCDCQNLSVVEYPRKQLPKIAKVSSHTKLAMDQVADYTFGGADSRGLFLGNCKGYLLTQLAIRDMHSVLGLSQGVDINGCHSGNLHGLTTTKLIGMISDTLRVHDNCTRLYLREVKSDQKQTKSYRALLEDVISVVDTIDSSSTSGEKDVAFNKLTSLLRVAYTDNNLLAFEAPSFIKQLQLC